MYENDVTEGILNKQTFISENLEILTQTSSRNFIGKSDVIFIFSPRRNACTHSQFTMNEGKNSKYGGRIQRRCRAFCYFENPEIRVNFPTGSTLILPIDLPQQIPLTFPA